MKLTSYLTSTLYRRRAGKSAHLTDLNAIFTGYSASNKVLSADVANAEAVANTLGDITGLAFTVKAGKTYKFKFVINYSAAATTTGARFTINGPAAPTFLSYRSQYSLTTASETVNTGLAAYQLPAASNATSAATGANLAIIEGIIKPSVDGTLTPQLASEVTVSAITALAGSYGEVEEIVVS
jgi:hypothetical protein